MPRLPYSVVIATIDRPESLATVLACLDRQQHRPALVVLADASAGPATRDLATSWGDRLPVRHLPCARRSAALQRNHGAALASTPLVAFLDDDIEFPEDHFAKLAAVFDEEGAGDVAGVSGRESGMTHPLPGRLLGLYYRLQAGYPHPHYGARLLGLAINTVPCYERQPGPLVPSDWLPSTCVLYRRDLFETERFPEFVEYSYMEDVHLSARMGRRGRLLFCADAVFDHHSGTSAFKRDTFRLARHRIANRLRVAREVLGLGGPRLAWLLFLHRAFVTIFLIRNRPGRWLREIAGTWAPASPSTPR